MRSLNSMKASQSTVPPNKHMQRAGTHKVLGRGRPSVASCSALRARVLNYRRAGADVDR
jgi:hypothetical protein